MIKAKTQKGITLLALIITIVILIILASVTIGGINNNNGIISSTEAAKNKVEEEMENKNQLLNNIWDEEFPTYNTITGETTTHTHTEAIDAAVAATCTETGLTEGKHCSVCNEVLVAQTEVPALGHDWGEWTTTTEATETEVGEKRRDCKRCDEYETEPIPTLDHTHSYTVENTALTYRISPATCVEAARYYKSCSCGASAGDDNTIDATTMYNKFTFTVGNALEHNWILFAECAPTCENDGYKSYYCSNGCNRYG